MRQVTVAVVQMAPRLGEPEANLQRMASWAEDICRDQKTDLIVFPELATTGYECGVRFAELAELTSGPGVSHMAELARDLGVHIVLGMVEKQKVESVLYDSAVLINAKGEASATYRKVHLRGEERLAFRPGYRFVTAETALGLVGLLVGQDLAFPEAARCLMLQGAELVCACACWERPNTANWRTYALARAEENSLFVAAANRVGEEYTYSFFGSSLIAGPRGEVRATMQEDVEGYAVATIDLDEVRKNREETQLLQARQPRSYRELVRMY